MSLLQVDSPFSGLCHKSAHNAVPQPLSQDRIAPEALTGRLLAAYSVYFFTSDWSSTGWMQKVRLDYFLSKMVVFL